MGHKKTASLTILWVKRALPGKRVYYEIVNDFAVKSLADLQVVQQAVVQ